MGRETGPRREGWPGEASLRDLHETGQAAADWLSSRTG